MAIAILATDLAELAGPIGENTGKTSVRQVGICGAAAAIEATAESPAAGDGEFRVRIKGERMLGVENIKGREAVSGAARQFRAGQGRKGEGGAGRASNVRWDARRKG